MQYWLYLLLAIFLEVGGTISMKLSLGFTKLVPSIFVFVLYVSSITALTLALRALDLSLAYAVWAGVGTFLVTLVGIIFFREPVNALKIISIALLIFGIVGLRYSETIH